MSVVVEGITKKSVTLFRGDQPDSLATVQKEGIQASRRWVLSGFPDLEWERIRSYALVAGPSIAVSDQIGGRIIRQHITASLNGHSPFVSFSENPDVALWFATNTRAGPRSRGLFIKVTAHVNSVSWPGAEDNGHALKEAERGRCWFSSTELGFPLPLPTHETNAVKQFAKEQEFLLIGDVFPGESTLAVAIRCLSCGHVAQQADIALMKKTTRCPKCGRVG